MVFSQLESAGLHFTNDLSAGYFHFGRRANRQLLLFVIENDYLATLLQNFLHQGHVAGPVLNMVPGVADKKAIDRCVREERIIRSRKDGCDVFDFLVADISIHVQNHVGIDIDSIHAAAVAHFAGKPEAEVPRSRADVGQRFSGFHIQR